MIARGLWALALASLCAALVATVWFVAVTLPTRIPYWGEAEVLFEASRLRAHLPLFVDPLVGAGEYGPPPSRYYVTYPPLWAFVVSLAPTELAMVGARIVSTLAWFGALFGVALTARPASRKSALFAAAFASGIWVLVNFAMTGRPDSIACAVAIFALARAMRTGKLDVLGIVLFVFVPWIKPTLIGVPAFAVLGACFVDRKSAPRILAVAVGLAGASALVAYLASGGEIFAHVVRSNAQPFSADAWLAQVPARLPFFAPLVAWAAYCGWQDRRSAGTRIGLAALFGASAWTLFALGKTGSSSNYWMEPVAAAVTVIARCPPGPVVVFGRSLVHAALALVAVVWADVASVRGAMEHGRRMLADARFIGSLRERAHLPADAIVAADEAGIELVLDGRILTPTYQMVHLVRRGAYPAATWAADLTSPNVEAFVEHTGQLRLAPELMAKLEASFAIAFEEQGFKVWLRH